MRLSLPKVAVKKLESSGGDVTVFVANTAASRPLAFAASTVGDEAAAATAPAPSLATVPAAAATAEPPWNSAAANKQVVGFAPLLRRLRRGSAAPGRPRKHGEVLKACTEARFKAAKSAVALATLSAIAEAADPRDCGQSTKYFTNQPLLEKDRFVSP